jgi:hypothetical protein
LLSTATIAITAAAEGLRAATEICLIFASLSATFDFFRAGDPSFSDFQQSSFMFWKGVLSEAPALFRVSPIFRGILHETSPLLFSTGLPTSRNRFGSRSPSRERTGTKPGSLR